MHRDRLLAAFLAVSWFPQSLTGPVDVWSSRGMCLLLFHFFPDFLLLLSLENVVLQVAVVQVSQVPLNQVRIFCKLADQLIVLAGEVTLAACPWRS